MKVSNTVSTTSEASVNESNDVRVAKCSIPDVRLFAEYAELKNDADSAAAVINDAIATQTLLRSNGQPLQAFPTYYQLRFIATQEGDAEKNVDRGFFLANNTRRVRAASLVVYENSPKPGADGSTTVRTRSPRVKDISDDISIPWMGTVDDTLDNAFYVLIDYSMRRAAAERKTQEDAFQKVAESLAKNGLTIEDMKRLLGIK